jgi:hypothetical protein
VLFFDPTLNRTTKNSPLLHPPTHLPMLLSNSFFVDNNPREVGSQKEQLHGSTSGRLGLAAQCMLFTGLNSCKYVDVLVKAVRVKLKFSFTKLALPTLLDTMATVVAVWLEMVPNGNVMLSRNNDVSLRNTSTSHTNPLTAF